MEIIGKISKPRWYDIKCNCGFEIENKFPIKDCLHCKFERCEQSLPKTDFKVNRDILDEQGNITKTIVKTITKVTIVRGDKYEDIIGWTF
jgi:hypothetical protein